MKKIILLVCFLASILWGLFERHHGIKITDQVFLAFMFGIAIMWCD